MKKLEEVLQEMKEIEKDRQDIDLSMSTLNMLDDGKLRSRTYGEFEPSDACLKKLCSMYGLSMSHINALKNEQRYDLISDQFNHFLGNDDSMMKLRTVEGDRIKGIVSRNYQKFDDYDLFNFVDDYLKSEGLDYNMEFLNKDDEYTRIRFMLNDINENMGMADETGSDRDIVQGGFEVSNSEIGLRNMGVNSLVYRQICTNGMMGIGSEEDNAEIFHKRGRDFRPAARRNRLNQGLNNAVDQSNNSIRTFKLTKGINVKDPEREIKRIGDRNNLGQNHIESVQDCFNKERQYNVYGVLNSYTRHARDIGNNDYKNRSKIELIANNELNKYAEKV